MTPTLRALLAAATLLLLTPCSPAQTVVLPALPDTYVPTAPDNDSLYQALGGKDGIAALTQDFLKQLLADPRVEPFFRDADHPLLTSQMAILLCEVSGGPCKRVKHNIKRVHSGMDINRASFNAVVEVLQQTMDAHGIAFATQNRLLAQLAPMHRDIVNAE